MRNSSKIIKEAVIGVELVMAEVKEIEIAEIKPVEKVEEVKEEVKVEKEGGEEVNEIDVSTAVVAAKNTIEQIVEPVISEEAAVVTTVVTESIKVVSEIVGLKMVSESSLTDDQKKLAANIYESVKLALQDFISDPNVNNTVKITKTIGQVIKQLESGKVDGKVITGADKKAVAIQLGRILIKEVTPDDNGEAEILIVYDLIAEPTLEAMIEVSKVVNVVIHEMATKCCPSIFELFKRVK